jgi:serine-aspartate repeat-containing protein C/D/E
MSFDMGNVVGTTTTTSTFDTGSVVGTTTTASVVDTGSVVSTTTTESVVDTGSVAGTTITVSAVDTSSSFSDTSSTSTSEDTSSQQDTQQDTQSADTSTTETIVASADSSSDTSSISTSSSVIDSMDIEVSVIIVDAQVQDMQNEIETAIGGEMTTSEADIVADQIIAQNIESQQEALEEEQQETGEYADSTTLIAYMGYVPGFDAYKQVSLPIAASWYESRDIYTYVTIKDNTTAFFGLYGESMLGMTKLINLQPNL